MKYSFMSDIVLGSLVWQSVILILCSGVFCPPRNCSEVCHSEGKQLSKNTSLTQSLVSLVDHGTLVLYFHYLDLSVSMKNGFTLSSH